MCNFYYYINLCFLDWINKILIQFSLDKFNVFHINSVHFIFSLLQFSAKEYNLNESKH